MYIQEWKNNTESMLDAKMLQVVQFYLGGVTPQFVIDIYEKKYNLNGAMKNALASEGLSLKTQVTICARFAVESICCLYLLRLLFKRMVEKRLDPAENLVLWGLLIGFVYASSYLIVTPTADFRYRLASLFIFNFGAAFAMYRSCQYIGDCFAGSHHVGGGHEHSGCS